MQITIKKNGQDDQVFEAESGKTLLEALSLKGIRLDAPCGGRGKCGKCVLKVSGSISEPDEQEIKLLENRYSLRLACRAEALGDVVINIENQVVFSSIKAMGWSAPYEIKPSLREIELEILDRQDPTGSLDARGLITHNVDALNEITVVDSSYSRGRALVWQNELLQAWTIDEENDRHIGPLAAAFDLGTTGLALAVIDLKENKVIALETALNPQTATGSDVISRVTHTFDSEENLLDLQTMALDGLAGMVERAVGKEMGKNITAAIVSGNSIMQHLLAAVNPNTLAQAPYRPVFTHMLDISHLAPRLNISPRAKVLMSPMISSYVGGDIVSGILAVELKERPGNVVFIDIGTNGEIVMSRNGKLVATSCAAGPALEGMNILCGMRAATGAIDSFIMEEDYSFTFTTIGNTEAMGICGSALIDICAYLVNLGLINKKGLLSDPENKKILKDERFWLTDKVFLDQLDIRQVQLAKGAIAAAMEMLLELIGLSIADIDEIVIAGSFGYHLRTESLKAISLIPKDYMGPVTFVGNSSLAGSARMLLNSASPVEAMRIIQEVEVLDLGFDLNFQKIFIKHMSF